jgi:hypothetical protein
MQGSGFGDFAIWRFRDSAIRLPKQSRNHPITKSQNFLGGCLGCGDTHKLVQVNGFDLPVLAGKLSIDCDLREVPCAMDVGGAEMHCDAARIRRAGLNPISRGFVADLTPADKSNAAESSRSSHD